MIDFPETHPAPSRRRWSAAHGPCGVMVIVASALFVGCGEAAMEITTVQGKVTFNDQPVTSGLINFMAAGSRPLGGGIQPDGTYSFEIPPGKYEVRIDSPPALPADYKEGDPPPKLGPRLVPEKYAAYGSSGLTATVTGESPQKLDFTLP